MPASPAKADAFVLPACIGYCSGMKIARPLLIMAALALAPAGAQADVREQVRHYAISGTTAPELYFSIGERGPKAGIGRAIAHTDFDLTWRRDYQPRDGGCTLVSARPNLTITYTLPRPSGALEPDLRRRWDGFSQGIAAHEKVHGRLIVEMVREIEAVSVGMHVPGDTGCKAIRAQLQKRLGEISQRNRVRHRDFDREELSAGGKVHQLILDFVNTP